MADPSSAPSSPSKFPATPTSARRASVRWSDEPSSPNAAATSPRLTASPTPASASELVALHAAASGPSSEASQTVAQSGSRSPFAFGRAPTSHVETASKHLSYAEHRAARQGAPAPPALQPYGSTTPQARSSNTTSSPTKGPPATQIYASRPAVPVVHASNLQPITFFSPMYPFGAAPDQAANNNQFAPAFDSPQTAMPREGAGHALPVTAEVGPADEPAVPQPTYHGYLPAPVHFWRVDPSSPTPPGSARSLPGYSSVPIPPAPPVPPAAAPANTPATVNPVLLPLARTMYGQSEAVAALREEREERRPSVETLVDDSDHPQKPKMDDIEAGMGHSRQSGSLDLGATGAGDPRHRTATPQRPALKRSTTDESVFIDSARNAANIVRSHLPSTRRDDRADAPATGGTDGREKANEATGGVLSHLLKLYGDDDRMAMYRTDSATSYATTLGDLKSVPASRTTSIDSQLPHRDEGGLRKRRTDVDDDEVEGHLKPVHRPKPKRRDSDTFSIDSTRSVAKLKDFVSAKLRSRKDKKRERRASITKHVADILQRHHFVLNLAKALMTTGAPSHRLESQLNATARVLEIDAQFVHLPSIVIATFGDYETRTSETHFVKAVGGELDVGRLHRVHEVYKSVVHDQMGVSEGSALLHQILNEAPCYPRWLRILLAGLGCGVICMLGFDGSFIDSFIAAAFGSFLSFMQLRAAKNQLFSNIFEISIATLISFVSRGLGRTEYFCYESISSAGVSLVLPGYAILCGSLELASKNLIAGSVRMVFAIIYSLFLGFGLSIGSDFYFLFDPAARQQIAASSAALNTYALAGSFSGLNGTLPIVSGTFTLTNETSDAFTVLQDGNVQCFRDPSWQWYRQSINPFWMFLLVPMFSFILSLVSLQPLKTKELPIMVTIACAGFTCNFFANQYIFDRSDVVSFIGSFVVGLLGNIYSRIFKSTAFTNMIVGVLFLVPSGISAAGGLAMTYRAPDGDSYSTGLVIGFRMISTAIGITVGLFFSSFVVYSFGHGKSSAAFTF